MKHIAIAALMLSIGAASVNAHEQPVKMRFSGTNVVTTITLRPNTVTDEMHSEGTGTYGRFTFRELHADGAATQPPNNCFSPRYFAVVAGGGAFTFRDGSLLTVTVMEGSGCIDAAAGTSVFIVKYQVTGGTGRFEGASGELTLTATQRLVFRNAANAPALLFLSGEIEGTVTEQPDEDRHHRR